MAGGNKITDPALAKEIPGGGKQPTSIETYIIDASDQLIEGKDPDSQTQIKGKKEIMIRMKKTTGDYFGLKEIPRADLESIMKTKTSKGGRSTPRGARGTKSFTVVLKKPASVGGSSGTKTLSVPMPGTIGILEFMYVLDKFPKKTNIRGFRTPNGRYWSYSPK